MLNEHWCLSSTVQGSWYNEKVLQLNPLQRPPWGQKKVAIVVQVALVDRLKQEWMYGLSVKKMAAIETWPLWRGDLVIRGGSTEYIILLLVNKNYGMPYSRGSDWLSKEAHQKSLQSSSPGFKSCCGHLPDLFLVSALIVNSFTGYV